jgi:hypothetical protein
MKSHGKKNIEVDLPNTLEDGWWKEKHGFQFAKFFLCKPEI